MEGCHKLVHIWLSHRISFICVGKFGALFASIPFTIFAAIYCVMFGLVGSYSGSTLALLMSSLFPWHNMIFFSCGFPASVGLSFLQFTNMNSMRNLFITGVSLFLGLSIPEYFREYTFAAHKGPAHTDAGWVS